MVSAIVSAFAEDPVLPAGSDKSVIEDNLLKGLASENQGLQRSCALMLGKIKSGRAVIPLMSVLKNSDQPEIKVAAAWALCNIGDPRGTFAVKQEVEFSENNKTRLTCAWYYENMVQSGTYVFPKVGETVLAETKE